MSRLTPDIIANSFAQPTDKAGNREKDPVTVWVDGVLYNPWIDLSVQRNLDSMAGSCSLSFVDRWRQDNADWPLAPDKEVLIKVNNEPLITGYIDTLDVSISNNDRSISVSARDKTADLIDCSHIGANTIKQTTFEALAKALAEPFGISVVFNATPNNEPFDFESEQAESVFDALMRYATSRGYLLQTNESGDLVIFNREASSRIERSTTDLVQGENILSASANYDNSERFSSYIVKGSSPGDDLLSRVESANNNTTKANSSKGEASDEAIDRYRPKLIISDDNTTFTSAQKQAEWEADIRARQSTTVSISVQGWTKGDGSLWKINELVRVEAGFLGINQDLLITGINYTKSVGSGTITELELTNPNSFKAEAVKSKDDDIVKRPAGWKSPGAVGTIEDVAKLFSKRLKSGS